MHLIGEAQHIPLRPVLALAIWVVVGLTFVIIGLKLGVQFMIAILRYGVDELRENIRDRLHPPPPNDGSVEPITWKDVP